MAPQRWATDSRSVMLTNGCFERAVVTMVVPPKRIKRTEGTTISSMSLPYHQNRMNYGVFLGAGPSHDQQNRTVACGLQTCHLVCECHRSVQGQLLAVSPPTFLPCSTPHPWRPINSVIQKRPLIGHIRPGSACPSRRVPRVRWWSASPRPAPRSSQLRSTGSRTSTTVSRLSFRPCAGNCSRSSRGR